MLIRPAGAGYHRAPECDKKNARAATHKVAKWALCRLPSLLESRFYRIENCFSLNYLQNTQHNMPDGRVWHSDLSRRKPKVALPTRNGGPGIIRKTWWRILSACWSIMMTEYRNKAANMRVWAHILQHITLTTVLVTTKLNAWSRITWWRYITGSADITSPL